MRAVTKNREPSICLTPKSIHYVLLNDTGRLIGGAEVQQKILLDALANKGWKISVITKKVDVEKNRAESENDYISRIGFRTS
jgi:hypothetical protein